MTARTKKEIFFDKMMRLPAFRLLNPFYQEHREMLLYLYFGGLTFVVSVASYALFSTVFHMSELIANVFSWILSVSFAYETNRLWVFESRVETARGFFREIESFLSGRLLTLAVEELLILVFITLLHFPSLLVKIAAQIVVIFLNYILSKYWIFKK